MKKIIFAASFAFMLLTLGSCTSQGYVSSEPTYIEYERPNRPSNLHIWIDGDWVYNRQTKVYVRQNGHWQKSSRNRTYVAGRWQSTPMGLVWQTGHWQR
jgi:P pilus assembly chaperone PapD